MDGILTRTQPNRPRHLIRWTLLTALALVLSGAFWVPYIQSIITPYDEDAVIAAIEDQYGVHVSMIAVTMGGGAVDFRFQIVDPDKATNFCYDYENLPVLIVESNGQQIKPREHTHHVNYEFGRTYYQLYRNPGGIVKSGTRMTVQIGDLELKHVVAY
ncbi:MAG: hypothetical protein H6669_13355 [Ardenticatenaceae bacterium]|nr:hypothetical protein [Ardenticatenaceae bacterium]